MARETASVLDGALAGMDTARQSRHKRRAVRAALHGPSQRVLWRQLTGGERLECGHVGPFIPLTKPHGHEVYRRCAACRDGLPVADREWFDAYMLEQAELEQKERAHEIARTRADVSRFMAAIWSALVSPWTVP